VPLSGGELRTMVLEGVALHSGARARVTLLARPGPVGVSAGDLDVPIEDFTVASTVRATTIVALGGRVRVAMVEHAFAALAGLGIRDGLTLVVEGPELPLLDGGAGEWCEAAQSLALPKSDPPLRVARAGAVEVGTSRYEFHPADDIDVEVRLVLDHPRVTREARWTGDAADFRARIAPARTFVLASEIDSLSRQGLIRHVDPRSVVVLSAKGVHCTGPFAEDEPARHKLLDLVGDAYLVGGPPVGRMCAVRPGHAANAAAFRQACAEGILVRIRSTPGRSGRPN